MLTADLIRASCKDGVATLKPLHGLSRKRLLKLADDLTDVLAEHTGRSVRDLQAAWSEVQAGPREAKARDALCKLLLDDCELSDPAVLDASERRTQLVLAAAEARRHGRFDREALLSAHALPSAPDELERVLYADRPELRHVLRPSVLAAETLVDDFDRHQARALLLSAHSLSVWLPATAHRSLRRLVQRCKFLGLLVQAQVHGDQIELTCDGPASVLETGPRYGMAFANLFPELEGLSAFRLEAEVRLSARSRGRFTWEGGHGQEDSVQSTQDAELIQLQERLRPHFDSVEPAAEILIGREGAALVPDLRVRLGTRVVHLEWLQRHPVATLLRRLDSLTEGANDLVICFKMPTPQSADAKRLPASLPAWAFGYRRTLSTEKMVQHLAHFTHETS